ncbi:S-layer homology domain-containing protein [Phosphitispora fastidiosa]|uniref:S-layer homology domain-containing protein n=1 Tax=Phosphitispora fastidiosa TaxID=2837202 RepID=UPI001E34D98D|nr:YcdB/YcdC domain-containing protein [Phosphitispora fastidiosa]MBU7008657.1 putative small secreted protein [Phosphitispora fastidiosa]
MKRKVLSAAIIMTLLFSIVSPAWAQGESAKISQEEALKIAKNAFGISDNQKNVNIAYREGEYQGNKKTWEFQWDLSRYNKFHIIRVEVNADTGEIISYMDEKEYDPKGKPNAKLKSKEECKVIAETLIQKLAPQKYQEIKEIKSPIPEYLYWGYSSRAYSFRYERQVNGVPFPENSINVAVNAETGKVANYYLNWDDVVKFPSADNTITLEQAEKIFREKIGLGLNYVQTSGFYPPGPKANKKPVQLCYSIDAQYGPPRLIDALKGKIIDQNGKEVSVEQKVYLTAKEEPSVPQKKDKVLTLEEAKAKVDDYINIPGGYKLQSSRYSEGWGGGNQKTWNFQYESSDYNPYESYNVTVNAVTGELLSYNRWNGPWEEQKDRQMKYDYTKCKQIAQNFLKKVAANKVDYVYLREDLNRQQIIYLNGKPQTLPSYSFIFTRVVNGVSFSSNSINIEVDNNTGQVRGFWLNWDSDLQFVSTDAVITEQAALDALLVKEKPRLVYTRKLSEDGRPSQEVLLTFALFTEDPKTVNAKTGKVTSYYELEDSVKIDDIELHWAEREIRTLAAWGIISGSNNKFYPDKPITRAEFITMLGTSKGLEAPAGAAKDFTDVPKSAWFYNAVQAAVQAGIAKGSGSTFEPNKVITKQEIMVMLINALNGSDESDIAGELPEQFKDENKIAPWAKQAVFKAFNLGIVSGEDGYLKPDNPSTKAEAAVMLFKALEYSSQNGGFGYTD